MISVGLLQYVLPVLVAGFLFWTMLVPVLRFRAKPEHAGINPIAVNLFLAESAHDYIARMVVIIPACMGAVVLSFTFMPQLYNLSMRIAALESDTFRAIGCALIVFALFIVAWAQMQMGSSWRVGIDENRRTDLVVHGLYVYSRNPIYVGILCCVNGLFFCLPNAITLVATVSTYLLLNIQIRLEEEHLRKLHGASFDTYCQRTRRWL